MAIFDDAYFLLSFFIFIDHRLLVWSALCLYFAFGSTIFASSIDFSGGVGSSLLFSLMMSYFAILAHGFGWISSAFMSGRVIEEVGQLWLIPSFCFMMFVEFDFEVDLHSIIITVFEQTFQSTLQLFWLFLRWNQIIVWEIGAFDNMINYNSW